MESHAAQPPGTPLFVRPSYRGSTWLPTAIDYGLLLDGRVISERFENDR